jgi:hypothetical protein
MGKIAMPAKAKMNPRKALIKYGACSHAMFCIINHEFDNKRESEEKASDILAGGIHKGYQCSLLWGSSLAIGTEAYKRFGHKGAYTAIAASRNLVDSFRKRAKTMDCRDISKTNWENRIELIIYMIKAIAHGLVYNPCFNLIAKWPPEAVATINTALEKKPDQNRLYKSCASEVIKKRWPRTKNRLWSQDLLEAHSSRVSPTPQTEPWQPGRNSPKRIFFPKRCVD